jgi:hypothetical protein
MQSPFVIAPVSRLDFQMLSDAAVLQLLAIFGVNVNQPGQIYPRVDSTVQVKTFQSTIDLAYKALDTLVPSDGLIDRQRVEDLQVLNH